MNSKNNINFFLQDYVIFTALDWLLGVTWYFHYRCDIYQLKSKQELQQLISGFVRFLETLNKMRRTAQTRRQKVGLKPVSFMIPCHKEISFWKSTCKPFTMSVYNYELLLDCIFICIFFLWQHSGDNVSSTPTSDQQTSQAR